MPKTNLGIFIPHAFCPNKCSFCNQHVITGAEKSFNVHEIQSIAEERLPFLIKGGYTAEIAFFGGTFTALPDDVMSEYLEIAAFYLKRNPEVFKGIRCSTRPDCVNEHKLLLLKKYGATAVELGAQSMDDNVLRLNRRGHDAQQTRAAAKLIKAAGFELGLQMMTGLFGDTREKSVYTANEFVKMGPDTARIYPTVIMPDTELCELYEKGKFKPLSFNETIDLCAEIYEILTENNIKIIRIGLDTSREIEEKMRGGCYHPALGELCKGRYYFNKIIRLISDNVKNEFIIYSDKKYFSKILGHKNENKKKLENMGFKFKIKEEKGSMPVLETEEGRKRVF